MVPGGGNGAKGKLGWWSQRVVAEGAQWCMMDGGEGREKKECESVRELFLSISFFKKKFFLVNFRGDKMPLYNSLIDKFLMCTHIKDTSHLPIS